MSKQPAKGKLDVRYWKPKLFRNTYTRGGERTAVADWCIKVARGGRRETVNLGTANNETAATKARDFYLLLLEAGWEVALEKYKPKPKAAETKEAPTLGDLFTAADQRAVHIRPTTLRHYQGCLRQIAADLAGIERTGKRYDHVNRGHLIWRGLVDALRVSILSPDQLPAWLSAYVKAAGSSPEAVRRAMTSANSIAGNAARLFTPVMLQHYEDAGVAVTVNPFAKLKRFKKPDSRYISRLEPAEVLRAAHDDLRAPPPERTRPLTGITKEMAAILAADRPQMYRVILLGTMTGLRRSELDRLQWGHIDFARNTLMVQSTADGSVKGVGSTRQVDLPEDLTATLEAWKKAATSLYVIECDNQAKPGATHRAYRCGRVFDKAAAWLRAKFLPGEHHPLHTLRKEYGSLIAQHAGIHAAADLLGHRDIRTASEYYVVRKTRAFTGLHVPQGVVDINPQAKGDILN